MEGSGPYTTVTTRRRPLHGAVAATIAAFILALLLGSMTASADPAEHLTSKAPAPGPSHTPTPMVVLTPDPAAAGARLPGATPAPVPSTLDEVPEAELLVEGLTSDYDLTRSEAEQRILWQAATSDFSSIVPSLLGSAHGGGWVDNSDGGRVKIGVTAAATDQQLEAVRALLAERSATEFTDILTVAYSVQELNEAIDWLVHRLGPADAGAPWPIDAGIDHQVNKVLLDVNNLAAVTRGQQAVIDEAVARFGDMIAIEEERRSAGSRTTCVDSDCNAPLRGGVRIVRLNAPQFPCTAGFNARSNSNNLPYVLTAGHCIHNLTTTWYSYRASGQQLAVGPRHNSVFGNNQGDYGIIRNNHGNWPTSAFVLVHAGTDTTRDTRYVVRRTGFSERGRRICYTDVASLTKCGEIHKLNQSFTDGGVTTVGLGMIKGPCGINGDSGGPAYAYGTAYGVMVARTQGWINCYTYYQGLIGAAHHMNVWVVTG